MKESLVILGLLNPKTPSNVGSVMRAAGCYQVNSVHYTGQRYGRAAKFNTDTHHSKQDIPLIGVNCLLQSVPKKMDIVCVELVVGAIPLPAYEHPEKAFYLFGPEDGSISQQIIDKANAVVYIPTQGCMNLAATVNVLLYDRLAKLGLNYDDEALIFQNRDNRNHLRVKRRPDGD